MRWFASEKDSFHCASQPAQRETAKMTVNMFRGMPMARSTIPCAGVAVVGSCAWRSGVLSVRRGKSGGSAHRVEVDVGVELPLDEILVRQRGRLELLRESQLGQVAHVHGLEHL